MDYLELLLYLILTSWKCAYADELVCCRHYCYAQSNAWRYYPTLVKYVEVRTTDKLDDTARGEASSAIFHTGVCTG